MASKFTKLDQEAKKVKAELTFKSPKSGAVLGTATGADQAKEVAHLKLDSDASYRHVWSAETLRAAADWLDELNGVKPKKSFFKRKKK